jgi:hypothetical protein
MDDREHLDKVPVERSELLMIAEAVDILKVGGDVRGAFLDSATSLLVRAGQCIATERFVYVQGLSYILRPEWDALCQATHAATFASRIAESVGVEAQEHIDSWLLDVVPVLARLVENCRSRTSPQG